MRYLRFLLSLALVSAPLAILAKDYTLSTFTRQQLTDQFWSEGANYGDFNNDGQLDIASGPFIYPGPTYAERYEYRPATTTFELQEPDGTKAQIPGYEGALGVKNAYSDHFFTFVWDFNSDGWTDIYVIGMPGENSHWFENPQGKPGHWKQHLALDVPDNESPLLGDLNGDGQPEAICNSQGCFGYSAPNPEDPTQPWVFHPISPDNKYHRYNHGLGIGDVNGDNRLDILEKDGWWEQPASLENDPVWTRHVYAFCPPTQEGIPVGGAQMFAYDVNDDGLNDVITSQAAHGYGLIWHEQMRVDGEIDFIPHRFMYKEPSDNRYGVKFSQLHAVDLFDVDGDGLKDIVTGKRFWAHGPTGDVEPDAPAVLYWWQLVRGEDGAIDFVPHLIDSDSGVGTQVVTGDVTGDGLPDVVVGNKKGTFLFTQQQTVVGPAAYEQAQPKPRFSFYHHRPEMHALPSPKGLVGGTHDHLMCCHIE